MDRLRDCAELSVRRGVGFAVLGILSTMAGLVFDPVLATKAGAVLFGLCAGVLAWRARTAPTRPYRSTEVFLMLEERLGLSDEAAQRMIGGVLRDCYERHAVLATWAALALWVASLVLALARHLSAAL